MKLHRVNIGEDNVHQHGKRRCNAVNHNGFLGIRRIANGDHVARIVVYADLSHRETAYGSVKIKPHVDDVRRCRVDRCACNLPAPYFALQLRHIRGGFIVHPAAVADCRLNDVDLFAGHHRPRDLGLANICDKRSVFPLVYGGFHRLQNLICSSHSALLLCFVPLFSLILFSLSADDLYFLSPPAV